MARAIKGAQRITVGGVAYRWRATGNDDGIDLTVWPTRRGGRSLYACFNYDFRIPPPATGGHSMHDQVVITNRLVRRVIELAIAEAGYDPGADGTPLELRRIDARIRMDDAVRAR